MFLEYNFCFPFLIVNITFELFWTSNGFQDDHGVIILSYPLTCLVSSLFLVFYLFVP